MLDEFVIFSKGGLILFSHTYSRIDGDPINDMISHIILERRDQVASYSSGSSAIQWKTNNEYDIILAAVYPKLLERSIRYIPRLLDTISSEFIELYGKQILSNNWNLKLDSGSQFVPQGNHIDQSSSLASLCNGQVEMVEPLGEYDTQFLKTFDAIQKRDVEMRHAQKQPASFWETNKGQEIVKNRGQPKETNNKGDIAAKAVTNGSSSSSNSSSKRMGQTEQKLALPTKAKKKPSWQPQPVDLAQLNKCDPEAWYGDDLKHSSTSMAADLDSLQFAEKLSSVSFGDITSNSYTFDKETGRGDSPGDEWDMDEEEEEDIAAETTSKSTAKASIFGSVFKHFKGLMHKELDDKALKPVLEDIRTQLIAKNVASEIASSLCQSVSQSLLGKTHANYRSLSRTVKEAMVDALTTILTPYRPIDIPHLVQDAKRKGKLFTIVFIGVNGVGKSTSLAKLCAWMVKLKYRTMIAACDTFRSGAIEQLKVHAKALGGIPLFDQGYGKDAVTTAKQAIIKAKRDQHDVLLIDTCGRMQDNQPLMQALGNLVKINQPDLIFFVGEALVGNDSIDQLTKFNSALEEYGDINCPHVIDGIILTKFDTVDDKIGAAISMVYTTGKPIVLVGTGQTYGDLKSLNINQVVDMLLRV